MAVIKATILQNFATIGIPDFEEEVSKNWSIVGLSEHLIDEERLEGFQHLNTRSLDLVIHNGSKFAFMNLQAFKIFECEIATSTVRECLTHYLTPNGNLLFGVQPTGDVVVLTEGLQNLKYIKKPTFLKLQPKQSRWYDDIPGKIAEFFGVSKSRTNQVNPEAATLQSIHITGRRSMSSPSVSWWETGGSSSFSSSGLSENIKCQFPFLTTLLDGLAVFCAFNPADCHLFLSSYETALRTKTIANIRGSQVPGQWYRIIMQKGFIAKWLEEKREVPFFDARLCYTTSESGESVVGGAMLYGVMENMQLELLYGIIKRRTDKFTMSWEILQFDVNWARRESDGEVYNLGARYVAKLSSDCKKVAIVISNHLGMYIHVQDIPTYVQQPIQLKRQRVSLCNHSDYDGCHFYKQDCWIADVQWLVEDAYFAVMTRCGSLSIFYSSGEPMIVKVCKPGPEPDDGKSARFYFPVFHPHQIVSAKEQQQQNEQINFQQSSPASSPPYQQVYPTVKWIDSEQVLTCSSGKKIELFSIQRVLPITLEEGQSEIWLGEGKSNRISTNNRRQQVSFAKIQESYGAVSYSSSFTSARQSRVSRPSVHNITFGTNESVDSLHLRQSSHHHVQDRYDLEEDEVQDMSRNDYNPDNDLGDEDDNENVNPINDKEKSSHNEQELPPEGGEVVEEKLDNNDADDVIPTPEKLRLGRDNGKVTKSCEIPLDTDIVILSMPESLAQVETEEYSDGSSEPDFAADYQFITAPSVERVPSFPGEVEIKTVRKLSQQYMADDEADDDDDASAVCNIQRRRASSKTSQVVHFGNRTQSRSATTAEESDPPPRSTSAECETDYSRETYSSPFSCEPTTGEDNEDDDDDDNVVTPNSALVSACRSRSSTTPVSLQMPPVPKISGIIVPSQRQSDMLLRELSPSSSSKMQPELMKYRPPPTSTPVENFNIDNMSCFKNKTPTRVIETPEDKAQLFALDDEEEEEEEEFHECQDSVMRLRMMTNNGASNVTNFTTASDPPLRYRDSSV